MNPLASKSDVEGFVGRPLNPDEEGRYAAILAKASALFRTAAGQDFTPGVSTVRRKVNGGVVLLPQRPVTAVTAVVDDDGRPVRWKRIGQSLRVALDSSAFVTVTYAHGSAEVPDLVRLTVAEVVKKVLAIDPDAAAGLTQFGSTGGPYAEQKTYATWAQGGQTMLAPHDEAVARSFRVKGPNVWVQHAPTPHRSIDQEVIP